MYSKAFIHPTTVYVDLCLWRVAYFQVHSSGGLYFILYNSIVGYKLANYLHLLMHGNCLYELAAHVRATPLRRALNSHPVNIINVFLCFV